MPRIEMHEGTSSDVPCSLSTAAEVPASICVPHEVTTFMQQDKLHPVQPWDIGFFGTSLRSEDESEDLAGVRSAWQHPHDRFCSVRPTEAVSGISAALQQGNSALCPTRLVIRKAIKLTRSANIQ